MECVILVGLPGSGKTTFYHSRFQTTHQHVSKDLMRNVRRRAARQNALVEHALAAGRSVVVDNTNLTPAERAPLVELAKAHGALAVAYFFDSTTEDCLRRNTLRGGKARVPPAGIFMFARKLQPPSYAEGFDRVFTVHTGEEGKLEVREVPRLE